MTTATDPRAYGVVLSSASFDSTGPSLIAAYAPTLGAAQEQSARIHQAQEGVATYIVRRRPDGRYTDHRGRTPLEIIREDYAA